MCYKCNKSLDEFDDAIKSYRNAWEAKRKTLWDELEAKEKEFEAAVKPAWDKYLGKIKANHPKDD